MSLVGKRVLVVGASAGIGRAVATQAAAAGAQVVASARRGDRLAELDAHPIIADVTDDADCVRLVAEAVAHLGGLDGLVYAVGASPLIPLTDATGADWHAVFATNVIGAAQIISAAAPHLLEADGRAIALSSKAVNDPFPHLSLYSTSKVALDGLLRCIPKEFPGLRVTRVVIGNTIGTEFADAWDAEQLEASSNHWVEIGVLGTGGLMVVEQVAESILFALASTAYIPDISVIDHETDTPFG
jgi:NAD(P)-dependent dehydrogenase (short-subunit alcohol dehydrogenase family)